ncbi:MAG: hypothetical protein AAF770_03480 [Bacteroidota bacterium]
MINLSIFWLISSLGFFLIMILAKSIFAFFYYLFMLLMMPGSALRMISTKVWAVTIDFS